MRRERCATAVLQEAKEKEKKKKAAFAEESGGSLDELLLKIQTLQAEKKSEEEMRNYMQLERVSSSDDSHLQVTPEEETLNSFVTKLY